ncbi:MAG: hypothetical protein IPL65_03990 [Lewinellaceae bacterium]|nr:hypothetical protein [Lewinellaceae bacterium]
MKAAALYNIAIPHQLRLDNLVHDYTHFGTELLVESFQKIDRKLGGLQLKNAVSALQNGDFRTAADIALGYYDKSYQYGLDNNPSPAIRLLEFDTADPAVIAKELIARCDA